MEIEPSAPFCLSRRQLLAAGAAALATLALPRPARAALHPPTHTLSLHNLHTGEDLTLTVADGCPCPPQMMARVDHILRDHRNGAVHAIDPALLTLLGDLQASLGMGGCFQVISGYRSPATNARLRREGHHVARHSLHMQGKAIDIRLPGCDLPRLHAAARRLRRGGVGYYPRSGFVHVDTGRVRYW